MNKKDIGISPDSIFEKLRYVLYMEQNSSVLLSSPELLGPFISIMIFILSLRARSSADLIYFYFLLFFGTIFVFKIVDLMKESLTRLTLYQTSSILFYCFFPISIFSLYSLFFKINSLIGFLISLFFLFYTSIRTSTVFIEYYKMKKNSIALGYLFFVYYVCYIILIK